MPRGIIATRHFSLNKHKLIIYDLDGVIVDSSERHKLIDRDADARGDKEALLQSLYRFGATTDGDKPIKAGISLVMSLLESHQPCAAVAITGRCEYSRELTLQWLKEHTPIPVNNGTLVMQSPDSIDTISYKRNVVNELLENYDIIYAIDDSDSLCNMYKEFGIPTLHFRYKDADCLFISQEEKKIHSIV